MLRKATARAVARTLNLKKNRARAHPKPWSDAELQFRTTYEECRKIKRGCKWCSQAAATCCMDFEKNQSRLRIWRHEMRNVSSSRHEAEILLIFGASSRRAPEPIEAGSSAKPNAQDHDDAELSDATQLTSLSCESDGQAEGTLSLQTDGTQQDLRPSLRRKFKQIGSESDAETRAMSLKRKFQETGSESDCETQATSLSSQTSVQTSPSPPSHLPRRQKPHGPPRPQSSTYRPRGQGQALRGFRAIDLTNLVFPPSTPKVCRRSALHFLGLSEQRVRRVCNGTPDGRTRGHRLPNSHPTFAPQLTTCHNFLNHCWHFLAEGLPDKFSIAKGDGCPRALTLGTSNVRICEHLVPESDSGDSGEEDERSICGLALHIQSGEGAGAVALRGPAYGGAPCRYLGVVRPVTLFHLMGEWCSSRNLTCPSFSSLLRAILEAKPYLKLRKSAGQHANCEVCVTFKIALKKILSVESRQELLEAYGRMFFFNIFSLARKPSPSHPSPIISYSIYYIYPSLDVV